MEEKPELKFLSDHLKADENGKIVIRQEMKRVKAALEKIPEETLEQVAVHYKSKSYFDTTSHTARSQRRNKELIKGYGNKRSKKLKIDLHCQELKMVQALADTFGCSEAEAIRIAIHEIQARMRQGQMRKLYSDPGSTKLNASESKLLWIAEKIEQGRWVEPNQWKAGQLNEDLDW